MKAKAPIATFLYHEVTDDPSTSGFQRPSALPYKHSRSAFARHLGAIAAAGREPELATEVDFATMGAISFWRLTTAARALSTSPSNWHGAAGKVTSS